MASFPPGVLKRDLANQRNIKTACIFGDSFTSDTANVFKGVTFAAPVNITGISLRGGDLSNTAGITITLNVAGAVKTLQLNVTGDTLGPAVAAVDGLLLLTSGNGLNTLRLGVTSRLLPGASTSDTLASTGRLWRRCQGSMSGIVEAMTNRALTFIDDLGINGNSTGDMVARQGQIFSQPVDVLWGNGGTNDKIAAGLTNAQTGANVTTLFQASQAAGIPLVWNGITPRFGVIGADGAANADNGYTAALNSDLIRKNATISAIQRAFPSVAYNDVWHQTVDHITGKALNYTTKEGLHPVSMSMPLALGFYSWWKAHSSINSFNQNAGSGSYYDATNNPSGNLITASQGQFSGTGGTLSTGASLTPRWLPTAAYVKDTGWVISCGCLWRCAVGGTSGSVAPIGPVGTTFSDGSVVWQCIQAGVLAPWVTGVRVDIGDVLVVPGNKVCLYTAAGTTGASAPNPVGSAVTDGTATCINNGIGGDTGFGLGWTVARNKGSAMTIQCHKLIIDGKIWQEFIFAGAVGDERQGQAEEALITPVVLSAASLAAMNALPAGTLFDQSLPFQMGEGDGCYGIYMDNLIVVGGNTALNITIEALQLQSHYYGLGALTGTNTLVLIPFPWQPATTSSTPRIHVQSKANRVFRVRMMDFDCHAVV